MNYGAQRVFGTIGFGITALISGFAVDHYTESDPTRNVILPAVVVMLIFGFFDLISIKKLKLPKLSSTESIYKDVKVLLRNRKIALFLVFATIAGILDSFIIYFMFWHLEDVAERTGYMSEIKLIEGCIVAAECLGGEVLFFLISGKILKKIGYVHCLSFCFFNYFIRLGLISIITNPWQLVFVEFFMQGATYALCYTCIVAYAAAIAPEGTSATVQGLVAGMDDGLGFSIGSLIGGLMFSKFGGEVSFKFFSLLAILTCVSHIIIRPASKHETHESIKGKYGSPKEQTVPKIIVESNTVEQLENL
jgi:MFS family permease